MDNKLLLYFLLVVWVTELLSVDVRMACGSFVWFQNQFVKWKCPINLISAYLFFDIFQKSDLVKNFNGV